MFDKYMICEEGFRNIRSGGGIIGFEIGARLPYYRGLGLSMVEDIGVTVDGTAVPREQLRLRLRGKSYTLAQLETEYEEAWGMGEVGVVEVAWPGGLSRGPHQVELTEQLRVSYMPFPTRGRDLKTLTLTD
jgi:uncharacterized protein DUF6379